MDKKLEYIDTIDYKKLKSRVKDLVSVMTELNSKSVASRRLRYVEIDIEGERKSGRLMADELYIPQHIIDTNIRREQSSYIQYVTQSPRAAIISDKMTPSVDTQLIERDVTNRLRYDGWQLPIYACIDGFQQNGYGIMEVVYDESKPGHVAHEFVQLGDFGYVSDTRDLQEAELLGRSYFFSRTKLLALANDEATGFQLEQVMKIVEGEPISGLSDAVIDSKDKSLYKIDKVMFRVKGIVHVAWTCESRCDDWLCLPRPLFIGRRAPYSAEETQQLVMEAALAGRPLDQNVLATGQKAYETDYPYVIFPYLVSENDTISQLKGRVYLDQDTQEAATSLMSSFCTAHRRAAGMYFSKDTDDPNSDLMMQKNSYFKQGCIIPAKVKQFQLTAPDADVMQAIQSVISSNQNETSQVNFAAQNRKDSRKTATEISAASASQQNLSTVQVVLFSSALRQVYKLMFDIFQSRIISGLVKDVTPELKAMYGRVYQVKPAGDVDVIERQQLIQSMMTAWPVMQNTAAAPAFLSDMIMKMFPEQGSNYVQIIQQAAIMQQQQQAMVQQQVAQGIKALAANPHLLSDEGQQKALPAIQQVAAQLP